MNETLTLNDGTILEGSTALQVDSNLFIYIRNGSGIRDVFEQLIEPEKTGRIAAEQYGTETIYDGYTRLMSVRDEGNGQITAVLRRT